MIALSIKLFNFNPSDPRLKQLGQNQVDEWRRWFDTRLDDAIEAASTQQNPEIESKQAILATFTHLRLFMQEWSI